MKKLMLLVTLVCSLILFHGNALALRVSMERIDLPGDPPYLPGDNISFNVNISELGDHVAPSLGGFDMDILFNPDVLNYVADSVAFGAHLGNDPFAQWTDGPNSGPTYGGIAYDAIRIQEVSFETIDWLHNKQPDSFTLASLTFHAKNSGYSYIIPDNIELSNAYGITLSCDSIGIGSVNVIPEPGTVFLMSSGLLGLAALKKRRKRF